MAVTPVGVVPVPDPAATKAVKPPRRMEAKTVRSMAEGDVCVVAHEFPRKVAAQAPNGYTATVVGRGEDGSVGPATRRPIAVADAPTGPVAGASRRNPVSRLRG